MRSEFSKSGRGIPGNCLIGALVLMVRLRSLRVRAMRSQCGLPHFYVLDRRGRGYHFRLVRDFLPPPFCFLLFLGRFAELKPVHYGALAGGWDAESAS
jgi:hypothetical protein